MNNRQKFKELNKLERDLIKCLDAANSGLYKAGIALESLQEAAEELICFTDDELRGGN